MRKRTPPGETDAQKLQKRTPDAARRRAKSSAPVQTPKKRHPRRRRDWNPVLRGVAAVALVIELALIAFANPYLRVSKVRVDGAQTLPPAQVFEEARVPARTNIFWMALRQPFAQRLQADPVVDHAARRIKLPDTLILRVWERQPYATLALAGRCWLLDAHGVPFRAVAKPYPGVPVIAPHPGAIQGRALDPDAVALGTPLRADWLRHSYRLIALLGQDPNPAPTKIEVDQNGNLCLNKRNAPQIFLGQPDALPQKVALAQAAVMADGGALARRARYIDVSCPQQPAFMPRPEAENKPNRAE